MNMRNIVITSTLVAVFAAGSHAQTSAVPRSTPQQAQVLRQATPGRLIVPITGTLTTLGTQTTSTGSATSSAQATGSFSIQRFAQTTAGEVAAFGVLTLNLTDPTTGAPRMIVTDAAMRVLQSDDPSNSLAQSSTRSTAGTSAVMLSTASRATQTTSTQGCETLSLALAPVQIDVVGMAVRLDQVNVDVVSRTTGQLRTVLCGTTNRGVGSAERMNLLNSLLDTIG